MYFFLTISAKRYLDNRKANVAPIVDANETSNTALIGSKIIPDNNPRINANGREKVATTRYVLKKNIFNMMKLFSPNTLIRFKLSLIISTNSLGELVI